MERAIFKPVFNRKNRPDKEGKAPVEIYCYVDGKKKYINTGIRLHLTEWDEKRCQVSNETHENALRVNHRIKKMISSLEDYMMNAIEMSGSFTFEDLQGYGKDGVTGSFIDFLQEEVNMDRTVSPGTMRYRRLMITKLREACGDITFRSLKYDTITRFDNFMAGEGLQVSTQRKHHQQLRKYINIAVKKNLVKVNPYSQFQIRRPPRTLKRCLWYKDLDAIWNLSYNNMYEIVRLKFMFSCYTGLRISDNARLTWDHVQNGKIILKMQKTQQPVIVPLNILSDRTREILDMMDKDRDTVFPPVSDQVANRELKKIGIDAGIPFPLTFHTSRHTFCTLVAHKTGSMFEVMRYSGIHQVSTANTYVNLARLYAPEEV